ncbi:MAG: phosphoadenosine phosphosulfate reductase domain-containing protein, partial [Methanosarcinaceae archaeon]
KQFNAPLIPPGHLVVLNKAPYDDRMDEIIIDGEVIARIRFEIDGLRWTLLSGTGGARRLFSEKDRKNMRNWVEIDGDAVKFIVKGANVLAPGIADADPSIQEGDEIIVLTPENNVVAAGRARMNGETMLKREHGMAVKCRWSEAPCDVDIPKGGQTWADAVSANSNILDRFIDRSHKFIINVAKTTNRPVTVSYSGGKDSLATLQLVSECMDDYEIIFADTGLEFPETVENVQVAVKRYGHPLRLISVGDAFWRSVNDFGPPSVEVRWCCKVCKLGPITQLIEENYENGCLSYIGQRKYESSARAKSERVWKNPWVGNQVGAAPIQDWTALHVWLYIFRTGAPYNPLYEQGFDRIGCWLCPSSSLADLVLLKETHPDMEKRLTDYLLGYAKRMGLSKEWVEHGFWRWQTLPSHIAQIAHKKGINTVPISDGMDVLTFTITSGYRPCKADGMSAEGGFGTAIDLARIEDTQMLRAAGDVSYMEGVASVLHGEDRAQVFASGNVTARSDTEKKARRLMHRMELSIRRALKCRGCGVCVGNCPHDVIIIEDGVAVIGNGCVHCGQCIEVCPVVKFG